MGLPVSHTADDIVEKDPVNGEHGSWGATVFVGPFFDFLQRSRRHPHGLEPSDNPGGGAGLRWAAASRRPNGSFILSQDPTRGLKVPSEKNPKREWLDDAEFEAMVEAGDQVHPFIVRYW
ncbi:MAG: hypothetical protein U5R14_06245 [Gemmatimonadota bacterium]|nr:hypothetical protein [Gemmatimonadota bacterium]